MICEVCKRDRPLTYRTTRSTPDGKLYKSICATCIREHHGDTVALGDPNQPKFRPN